MEQNVHKDIYRFAYDEATTELRNILHSFEELCAKKNQVEKLLKVLKPEIGLAEEANANRRRERKSHLPHCVVVTRITVL
jgi:hypothetical protein